MDFSSANTELWGWMIQVGVIAGVILFANVLRRKIIFIQKSLMPTAVIAGFILLLIRTSGLIYIDLTFLESLTYHMLALGFIAMSLRTPDKNESATPYIGLKSGALIVSTYLVQAITGLLISIILGLTIMPDLFKASGILLPMAYGQGPGQANNVGTTYEALGMPGGRSFGLSLAATGFVCACVVGIIFLNIFNRKGRLHKVSEKESVSGSVTVDTFQAHDEIPVAESIDKFSIQFTLVALIYLLTYLATDGITALLALISPGLANTVSTLLWGFNFIIGSALAILVRVAFKNLRRFKVMNHQYQNNYLLSRMSGLAFDLMIVAGIASIDINDLSGYWLPFTLMAVAGGLITYLFLLFMSKKLYKGYENEGFFSMYGMLTGTLSSGILLLREIDPEMKTPAANNLVIGSSFGIVFGAPMLILVSLAGESDRMTYVTFGLCIIYLLLLLLIIFKVGKKKTNTK